MPQPKVTIVDDDRDTRELLSLALESEGFEVTAAANGLRLIASLQLKRPDVILMDVNMSWIDGFELCKAVKKNEQFRDIPVVFVSGRGEPEDRRRGVEAEAGVRGAGAGAGAEAAGRGAAAEAGRPVWAGAGAGGSEACEAEACGAGARLALSGPALTTGASAWGLADGEGNQPITAATPIEGS